MIAELVATTEQLTELQEEWDQTFNRCREPSIFNDFAYVRSVWRYFSEPTDRLHIVVVRHGGTIAAIAPWYITNGGQARQGSRMIRSISLLEGDKPDILVVEESEVVWEEILRFLCQRWGGWDMLRLDELTEESPALRHRLPGMSRFRRENTPMHASYFVSLQGRWEDYFTARPKGVQKSYLRRLRRLAEQAGPVSFLCLDQPDHIRQGLQRYVALEQLSWKKGTGIGISRSAASLGFYQEVLPELARRGRAEIHLLQANGIDIAACLKFKGRQKVYSRETTFHPAYAPYSPGTLLLAHSIQSYFGKEWLELDMMGMAGVSGLQEKRDWSTGQQHLFRTKIVNRWALLCSRAQRGLAKLVTSAR
jgi:CelD/BcsL family acetyltransferase involved in cellulose biosynthesis